MYRLKNKGSDLHIVFPPVFIAANQRRSLSVCPHLSKLTSLLPFELAMTRVRESSSSSSSSSLSLFFFFKKKPELTPGANSGRDVKAGRQGRGRAQRHRRGIAPKRKPVRTETREATHQPLSHSVTHSLNRLLHLCVYECMSTYTQHDMT